MPVQLEPLHQFHRGASLASKVGESTVADLQQVIGDLSPTELEKFKVALDEATIAARKKQARRRVKCGGPLSPKA
ncbi:hypothetical protein AK812_SmicGene2626 [Symbiodinium microadriaticum]|uniref:Uncharacterized protein n=1 Tax=Symbiodinium microadriaticum TaxID=2951 RepID=A0A1Q9F148_SYMMI|nr:hypothetical protein AK812_SmicGene2626 [Symbiodinium microadriaticum]